MQVSLSWKCTGKLTLDFADPECENKKGSGLIMEKFQYTITDEIGIHARPAGNSRKLSKRIPFKDHLEDRHKTGRRGKTDGSDGSRDPSWSDDQR